MLNIAEVVLENWKEWKAEEDWRLHERVDLLFRLFLGSADSVSAAFVCIVCAWISGSGGVLINFLGLGADLRSVYLATARTLSLANC